MHNITVHNITVHNITVHNITVHNITVHVSRQNNNIANDRDYDGDRDPTQLGVTAGQS